MPKFLAGKVVVKTFEVYAESDEQARAFIEKWQTGESEEPEGGIKAVTYKLAWEEGVNCVDPTEGRNHVLAAFLNLMQEVIPGIPKPEKNLIVLPHPGIIITDNQTSQPPPPSAA